MNPLAKKCAAVVVAALLLGIAYYGSYLPLRKSRAFIDILRNMGSIDSLDKLRQKYSAVLDIPSPIGQEELVRNFGNSLINLISQAGEDTELTSKVTALIESLYRPILERGRGMSFSQNLYVLGTINQVALIKTRETRYLDAAKRYFLRGLEGGPKRPQFLYPLFELYRIENKLDDAKRIGEQILKQWPSDQAVKQALESLGR